MEMRVKSSMNATTHRRGFVDDATTAEAIEAQRALEAATTTVLLFPRLCCCCDRTAEVHDENARAEAMAASLSGELCECVARVDKLEREKDKKRESFASKLHSRNR